ncbi:MAG: hypothetical protein QNK11_02605 [Legionella sp.]|nr:hypothetical protein [Legionella sp.]
MPHELDKLNQLRAFLFKEDFLAVQAELQDLNLSDFIEAHHDFNMTTPFMQAAWKNKDGPEAVKVQRVIQLMLAPNETSWLEFTQNLEDNNLDIFETYQKIEAEIYPGFAHDLKAFIAAAEKQGVDWRLFIPPQYQHRIDIIETIEETPERNLGGAVAAFFLGSGPFALSPTLAAAMTALTQDQKKAFTVLPTAFAGLLRLLSVQKTAEGYGQETAEILLALMAIGLALVAFITSHFDISTLEPSDSIYWALWGSVFLIALGLSTFSTMAMAADSAPGDSEEERNRRYQVTLGMQPESTLLGKILRSDKKVHGSIIGGLTGIATPMTTLIAPRATAAVGLSNTYLLTGMGVMAALPVLHCYWNNLPFDQLFRKEVPLRETRALAGFLGDKRKFVDPRRTFPQKIQNLDIGAWKACVMAIIRYTSFALFTLLCAVGPGMAEDHGMTEINAYDLIATGTLLSTLFRSGAGFLSCSRSTLMNTSLLTIVASLSWFASEKNIHRWAVTFAFVELGVGAANSASLALAQEEAPEHANLIFSAAGAMGVFSSMALEALPVTDLKYVFLLIFGLTVAHDYTKKKPVVSESVLSQSPHKFDYGAVSTEEGDLKKCQVLV